MTELYIKNFAIIDELRVKLGKGLNVLTGETGAGKSIIVDALGAALGQRVGSEVVRSGTDLSLVEAVFEPSAGEDGASELALHRLSALLLEHGLEIEEGLLILSREINRSTGRTVARVNSRSVPLSLLQQLGQLMVDIHGQSEHLSLLRAREHVDYLDRYAGLMDLREQVAQGVKELRAVRGDIEQMMRDERASAREIDLLSYQIQEIRGAGLAADEEERLLSERLRLRNAERLRELAHSVYELMNGSDEQKGAVDLLSEADRLYLELIRVDSDLELDRQELETARYAVEEIARRARGYAEAAESDPKRLDEVEERLELIVRLKRKYGGTVGDILKYCEESERKLERLSNGAYYLEELRQAEKGLVDRLAKQVVLLSRERKVAAVRLAEEVQRELADLNMGGTRFEVAFAVAPDPNGLPWDPAETHFSSSLERVSFDATGVDRVEFLVSPNPGEEPKSLARIASGGETARLMLALKTILCLADAIPTLVFDEIDVGVGARSGARVGEKLWRLTRHHQVLCITHMPQIACMADLHLSVAKVVDAGRTRTSVESLTGSPRVEELAAMLAGSAKFTAAVASAQELLARAEELKGCRI